MSYLIHILIQCKLEYALVNASAFETAENGQKLTNIYSRNNLVTALIVFLDIKNWIYVCFFVILACKDHNSHYMDENRLKEI